MPRSACQTVTICAYGSVLLLNLLLLMPHVKSRCWCLPSFYLPIHSLLFLPPCHPPPRVLLMVVVAVLLHRPVHFGGRSLPLLPLSLPMWPSVLHHLPFLPPLLLLLLLQLVVLALILPLLQDTSSSTIFTMKKKMTTRCG